MGIRNSFGIFIESFEMEFGLTRAVASSVFSAFLLLSGIFGITNGLLLDRYGARTLFVVMGFVTGLCLLITSKVEAFWQLYLSYSLLLAIGTGGIIPLAASAASKLLDRNQGLAIGIATAGTGFGALILAPLIGYLISNFGWRLSYIALGIISFVVVSGSGFFLSKKSNGANASKDGVSLQGFKKNAPADMSNSKRVNFTLTQALQTRSYWLIFSFFLFSALCSYFLITHIVPYAIDSGISIMQASTILSIFGGASALSRLLAGKICDVTGRKTPTIIFAVMGICAVISLIWSHELWMFYAIAIVYGISFGGFGVTALALTVDIFGSKHIGAILGATEMAYSLGSAIGATLGGWIFDTTNSYNIAFIIGGVALLITIPLVSFTRPED